MRWREALLSISDCFSDFLGLLRGLRLPSGAWRDAFPSGAWERQEMCYNPPPTPIPPKGTKEQPVKITDEKYIQGVMDDGKPSGGFVRRHSSLPDKHTHRIDVHFFVSEMAGENLVIQGTNLLQGASPITAKDARDILDSGLSMLDMGMDISSGLSVSGNVPKNLKFFVSVQAAFGRIPPLTLNNNPAKEAHLAKGMVVGGFNFQTNPSTMISKEDATTLLRQAIEHLDKEIKASQPVSP